MFLDAEEARRKAYAQEEEKRRQQEREHKERMQFMFLSFIQRMTAASLMTPSFVPHPTTYPYDPQMSMLLLTSPSFISHNGPFDPKMSMSLPRTQEPFV